MPRRINLVPQSERVRTTTDFGLLALLVVTIVVIFGLGLGYYLLDNQLGDREQELAQVRQQVAQLESQVAALRQYEVLQAQCNSAEATIQSIYAGRTLVSEVLDAVSLVVPESVWFQNLSLTAADPVSSSVASSAAGLSAGGQETGDFSVEARTYSFEDIAETLIRLQIIPALPGVKLTSAGQSDTGTGSTVKTKEFSLQGNLVNTQSPDTKLPVSQVEVEVDGL